MKALIAVLIQTLSFAALAGTANSTMSVTVTVVRPAAVVTLLQPAAPDAAPQVSVSGAKQSSDGRVRIVLVEY